MIIRGKTKREIEISQGARTVTIREVYFADQSMK